MKHTNIALLGLGQRGISLCRTLLFLEHVTVSAVCDLYADRAEQAAEFLSEHTGYTPFATTDYKQVLCRSDVDAVLIATSWEAHVQPAIDAMKAGKAVGLEVGGAYTVRDCYDLVEAYEQTGTPFMFLENCCFGKDELLATALVRAGKFGEIVHCAGTYGHDLRQEIAFGKENRHYRLRNYLSRNTENYPTHELGPIARILNINRGNRMVSLVSVASRAAGMQAYIQKNADTVDPALQDAVFAQGDIVDTIITCADGATVHLRLDTTLPRSYRRGLEVRGTKGLFEQDTYSVFYDGDKHWGPTPEYIERVLGNAKQEEHLLPKVWKEISPEALASAHGGMDYIELCVFIDALQKGDPMPIDVYDAAAWMVISALAEQSVAQGGAAVAIPDFTNGAWETRTQEDVVPLT